jgi:3-oxoacyl-[acyl-carrier protein] reductase
VAQVSSAEPRATRVAFVTGAGRGIGKALALGFARAGYGVVVGSTTPALNEAVADEIQASGGLALPVELDVADEASVEAAIAAGLARFGRIDALVNNAGLKGGFFPEGQRLLSEMPTDRWRRMIDVNLTGVFLCSRACAPIMTRQGRGSIINMSSSAGQRGRLGESLYGATKSGLDALTRGWAADLQEHNVAVNAIYPGMTVTERTNVEAMTPERRAMAMQTGASLPLALFLAEQEPITVTGEIIEALDWNMANGRGGREVWSVAAL